MAETLHGQTKQNRTQASKDDRLTAECGKICKSKSGRTQHERKVHLTHATDHECPKCGRRLAEKCHLTNHFKACKETGTPGQTIVVNRFTGTRERVQCPNCGSEVTKNNLSKHMTTAKCQSSSIPSRGRKA